MGKKRRARLKFVLLLCLLCLAITQAGQQPRTLMVTGTGELAVVGKGGHSYAEIQALAQLANASLSFNGNQLVLTLPGSSASAGATPSSGNQSPPGRLSRDFIRAGIEEMSAIREWRSTLTNAVRRGYPTMEEWMSSSRDERGKNLRLVEVAATTEPDRNARRGCGQS